MRNMVFLPRYGTGENLQNLILENFWIYLEREIGH